MMTDSPIICPVQARNRWNDTGLDVIAGETLRITASGNWVDLHVRCTASGFGSFSWVLRKTEGLRRRKDGRWFELSGAIGRTNDCLFAIGERPSVIMPASGRLYLFANDISAMYWNNWGKLIVTIDR